MTIGESKQADVLLSSDGLPVDNFPLVRTFAGRYVLCFTDRMTGELETQGRVMSLEQWRRAGARPDPTLPNTFLLPLSIDARAVVRWAGMTFALRFVPPPRPIPSSLLWQLDLPYLNIVMMSVLFHLIIGVCLAVYPYGAEQIEADRDDALIFVLNSPAARLLVPPEPPPEPLARIAPPSWKRPKLALRATPARPPRDGPSTRAPPRFRDFFASIGGSHRRILVGEPGLTREIANLVRSARRGPAQTLGFGIRDGTPRRTPALGLRTIGDIDTRPKIAIDLSLAPKPDRPAPEMISIGTPVTSPGLSREQIAEVVNDHRLQLRYCYEKELYVDGELSGRLQTRWLIGPDGGVREAEIVESTLQTESVGACVLERIRRWRFPEPAGGGVVEVNYPFLFRRS